MQRLDEPGRPDIRQSNRGPGTGQPHRGARDQHHEDAAERSAPVVPRHQRPPGRLPLLAAARPATWSTPTTARADSGPYARFGNRGPDATADPTIPKDEPGHPLRHEFTRSIPSTPVHDLPHAPARTCSSNSFLGYTWWDNEADGRPCGRRAAVPALRQRDATHQSATRRKPRSAACGATASSWPRSPSLNPQLKNTQFADFHGHGWIFRAVFKRDRKGNLLDAEGKAVARRRPREIQEGRPPEGHPPREGDALRGLPLQAGQPRQRPALRRARGRRSRSTASTATARPAGIRTCSHDRRARPGARIVSRLRTRMARRRFEWRDGRLLPALDGRSARSGRSRWSRTASIRAIRSTTRRPRAPS